MLLYAGIAVILCNKVFPAEPKVALSEASTVALKGGTPVPDDKDVLPPPNSDVEAGCPKEDVVDWPNVEAPPKADVVFWPKAEVEGWPKADVVD